MTVPRQRMKTREEGAAVVVSKPSRLSDVLAPKPAMVPFQGCEIPVRRVTLGDLSSWIAEERDFQDLLARVSAGDAVAMGEFVWLMPRRGDLELTLEHTLEVIGLGDVAGLVGEVIAAVGLESGEKKGPPANLTRD